MRPGFDTVIVGDGLVGGERVAAAAFRRGGHLWLAFDRELPPGFVEELEAREPDLGRIDSLVVPQSAVLRLALPPAVAPRLRPTAAGWRPYETPQDGRFYGVWIHDTERTVVTYIEGEEWTIKCPTDESRALFSSQGYSSGNYIPPAPPIMAFMSNSSFS